jgi:L-amino acid N-acyltransferase
MSVGATETSEEDLERLVRGLEACTIAKECWSHADHLRVALVYVRRHGRVDALERMRASLQRFIAAVGARDVGYHETITRAWLALVADFVDRQPGAQLGPVADALVSHFGDKGTLGRFYSKERLHSPEARATWVPPDLTALPGIPAVAVRLATGDDLAAINAIYNHYVATSTCTFQLTPSTAGERAAWLAAHAGAHPATVAEVDGEVVGWGSLSAYNPREAYARTAENSVYVRHDQHRRGVGRALLADLLQRARSLGHHTVIAGVSDDQEASLRLHREMGFVDGSLLRELGWKFERWIDVRYLQRML